MTLICANKTELGVFIAMAVKEGLTFEANSYTLTIVYTGGY